MRSPSVVIGDNALNAVVAEVCPVPPYASPNALVKFNVAIVAVPSINKFFHELAAEPRSRALSVEGTRSVLKRAVAVMVSLVALPSVVLPLIVALPPINKSFHELAAEPRSRALSVEGTRSVLKRAVAVMVSLVALPSVVLPLIVALPPTVRLPVMLPLTIVVTQELTLVPSQNKNAVSPAATATPVPAEVFKVTVKDVLFCNT